MSSTFSQEWLDLSDAAQMLGVHFTTLRRWADAGQVPCIRTPGGRRRFRAVELAAFLAGLRQHEKELAPSQPQSTTASGVTIHSVGVHEEPWYHRLDEAQRNAMRHEGQQLMAVLMQYATRQNGGEAFLQEGRRLAAYYGQECCRIGLSLTETVSAFLRVRRSILDAVYRAGALAGAPDADAWRLYDRMNTFLDHMLLATVERYAEEQQRLRLISPAGQPRALETGNP